MEIQKQSEAFAYRSSSSYPDLDDGERDWHANRPESDAPSAADLAEEEFWDKFDKEKAHYPRGYYAPYDGEDEPEEFDPVYTKEEAPGEIITEDDVEGDETPPFNLSELGGTYDDFDHALNDFEAGEDYYSKL